MYLNAPLRTCVLMLLPVCCWWTLNWWAALYSRQAPAFAGVLFTSVAAVQSFSCCSRSFAAIQFRPIFKAGILVVHEISEQTPCPCGGWRTQIPTGTTDQRCETTYHSSNQQESRGLMKHRQLLFAAPHTQGWSALFGWNMPVSCYNILLRKSCMCMIWIIRNHICHKGHYSFHVHLSLLLRLTILFFYPSQHEQPLSIFMVNSKRGMQLVT